jgi:4-amino-4-deoxy-L-arabinose transferase-like glycosyltransferase
LLSVQVVVLGLAILVRGSPIYLLGPVIAVGIYCVARNWRDPGLRLMLVRLVVPAAALITTLFTVAPLAFPEYAQAGLSRSIVWHRVFISFGFHPAWPFAGMREAYHCPGIPEGLIPGLVDRNGHCVWLAYANDHGLPFDQVLQKVYGREYEAAMRSAILDVVRTYPKEAFETFFYFKPKAGIDTTFRMLSLQYSIDQPLIRSLVILQFAIIVTCVIAWSVHASLICLAYGACLLSMFLLFSLVPQFLAWSLESTALDLVAYIICGGIIGFWSLFAVAAVVIDHFILSRLRS